MLKESHTLLTILYVAIYAGRLLPIHSGGSEQRASVLKLPGISRCEVNALISNFHNSPTIKHYDLLEENLKTLKKHTKFLDTFLTKRNKYVLLMVAQGYHPSNYV